MCLHSAGLWQLVSSCVCAWLQAASAAAKGCHLAGLPLMLFVGMGWPQLVALSGAGCCSGMTAESLGVPMMAEASQGLLAGQTTPLAMAAQSMAMSCCCWQLQFSTNAAPVQSHGHSWTARLHTAHTCRHLQDPWDPEHHDNSHQRSHD